MSDHVIEPGDKIHVITRRLFPEDLRRHFVGEVVRVTANLCEVQGYAFVFQVGVNEYRKRPDLRSRIVSLSDVGNIVNKLPRSVDIGKLEYRIIDKHLVVTDMKSFRLDINEFGVAS